MALFSFDQQLNGTGERLSGYARFRELLGRDFKRFFLVNLLTLTGFLPFFLGVLYALLSSSILVLIPACVIGGMLALLHVRCRISQPAGRPRRMHGKFQTRMETELEGIASPRHPFLPHAGLLRLHADDV